MPHLPNEIWILILSHCEPSDLWLSLRLISRQTRSCVEQHVQEEILPIAKLILPITLPTYDIRSPIRGKAIFHYVATTSKGDLNCAAFGLSETEPDHYRWHLLTRWHRMRNKTRDGELDENLRWDLDVGGNVARVGLRHAYARPEHCETETDEAKVEFDWKPTLTSFFRAQGFEIARICD